MNFSDLLKKFNDGLIDGAQKKLSRALGVELYNVSNWVNGRSFPSEDIRPRLAKVLRVTEKELMDSLKRSKTVKAVREQGTEYSSGQSGEVPMPGAFAMQIAMVPVVGVVSATNFTCPVEAPPEGFLPVPLPSGYKPGEVFGLRISGDCMEPTARDGEVAVIAKAHEAHDGQLCVVRVDGECTFKRVYRKGSDCVELRPDNPKFKPIKVAAKHAHIVGKVLWFYRKP